jgi:glycosyltransferase involved in cell wall biosynthesis
LSRALAKSGVNIKFVVPYEAEHNLDHMEILHATNIDPLHRFGGGAYTTDDVSQTIITPTGHKLSLRDVQARYVRFIEHYLSDPEHEHPDAVHAHDWLTYEAGILAKEKFGIPLIAHVHATEFDRGGADGGNPIIHEIEYAGLLAADRIFAVSEATKQIIVERYGIPGDKITAVYNGFDPDNFDDDYQYDAGLCCYLDQMRKDGNTIISTVGRLTIQKGLTHFLRAAKLALLINPKLVFVVAGDGEQRDDLLRMSAELGIASNVIFTGFIRGRELRDIYSVSDIFVMSSVSEPFGLTALEAAHHGDALILTHQSGVGELIWSAMKYNYWDEAKLANAIVTMSEEPALIRSLREGITREYTKMRWSDVADKCLAVYNEIEANKHKKDPA